MKAASIKHPDFELAKLTDVLAFFHFQMPRWLFCDTRYKGLSLEAKVAYTFLLNRFQLSRMNGWVNEAGEVFIIFPREKLAQEMQISYRKAIECFKELVAARLIYECRPGRGNANQIYLASIQISQREAESHMAAPFEPASARSAETALDDCPESESGQPSPTILSPELEDKTCEKGMSEPADFTAPELLNPHTSNTEFRENDKRNLSVDTAPREDELLDRILEQSELHLFDNETANVFTQAITRLFYAEYFRIGESRLPRPTVRKTLCMLNGSVLRSVEQKLHENTAQKIRNSSAYVMTVIINEICEYDADLLLDPDLNTFHLPIWPAGR